MSVELERGAQLREEPALAHPGLTDDARDTTLAGLGDLEGLNELTELGIAADHRRAHAGEATCVRSAFLEASNLVRTDGLGLAFEFELADVDRLDEQTDEAVGGGGDEHASRAGGSLHARRDIDRIAHSGVLGSGRGADDTDDDRSGVDADSHFELVGLRQMLGGVELFDGSDEIEAAADGALGVVLVGGRGAEKGEDAVPHEPGDGSVIALDRAVHPLERLADEGSPVLGIETFCNSSRSCDVGKEHGDRPTLARPSLACRPLGVRNRHAWQILRARIRVDRPAV